MQTINECLSDSVCYTHFVRLLFNDKYSYYNLYSYLAKSVLKPFKNVWDNNKGKTLINF